MTNRTMDFDSWYDSFVDNCRALNYEGILNREAAQKNYDAGMSYEAAAFALVEDMNDEED